MKKNLFILTLIMVTNLVSAQFTTIVEAAEKKNKLEEYIEYYDSGKVAFKSFKDKDGKLNGLSTLYYENGTIQAKGKLVNNLQEGEWEVYNEQSGKLELITNFEAGEVKSKKYFYESGKLKSFLPFVDDEIEGLGHEYYEDGSIKVNAEFKNGEFNGIFQLYYEDGSYEQEGTYVNGKKEGKWYYYKFSGYLYMIKTYKDGKLIATEDVEEVDIFPN